MILSHEIITDVKEFDFRTLFIFSSVDIVRNPSLVLIAIIYKNKVKPPDVPSCLAATLWQLDRCNPLPCIDEEPWFHSLTSYQSLNHLSGW